MEPISADCRCQRPCSVPVPQCQGTQEKSQVQQRDTKNEYNNQSYNVHSAVREKCWLPHGASQACSLTDGAQGSTRPTVAARKRLGGAWICFCVSMNS